MKALVIYRSRAGFSRQYAQWIAEELSAELIEVSRVTLECMLEHDVIIFGGGLYEAGINGVGCIKQYLDKLVGKKIIVFACGASPARPETAEVVLRRNFTDRQRQQIHFFYLRGGFAYDRLGARDRVLMTLLKWKLQWKRRSGKKLNGDEAGMLAAYENPLDFTKRKHLDALLACARIDAT